MRKFFFRTRNPTQTKTNKSLKEISALSKDLPNLLTPGENYELPTPENNQEMMKRTNSELELYAYFF